MERERETSTELASLSSTQQTAFSVSVSGDLLYRMTMTMHPPVKPGKLGFEEPQEVHRIRITLSLDIIGNIIG